MKKPYKDFSEKRPYIFPWIKANIGNDDTSLKPYEPLGKFIVESNKSEFAGEELELFGVQFVGDLIVLFAYDDPDDSSSVSLIFKNELPEDFTEEKLISLSIENLLREITFELFPTNFGGCMLVADGNYEVAALLCQSSVEFVTQYLKDDLIITAPAKAALFFAPSSNRQAIEKMKLVASDILNDEIKALSTCLFYFDKERKKLSLYEERLL